MFLGFERPIALAAAMWVMAGPAPSPRVLRVCADPNNMPFSNARGEGFENKIAELTADALGRQLQYYWQPQRRGFIRSTLRAGACDVVMGVLAGADMVRPTRPYYRSTYVFVTKKARGLHIHSFDDPRLQSLRIGIQITGNDYGNPPPAEALGVRRLVQNIHGFTVYGDYSKPYPQRSPIEAVQKGDVDVAIVWGPVAGFFAQSGVTDHDLELAPVVPGRADASIPFAFDVAMGVRREDSTLAAALDKVIASRKSSIAGILDEFHVPRLSGRSGT